MYRPSNYWDYLRANSEPAILASPDGHRWAQAVDSVERAESKGSPLHVEVTKTVALIEMFRTGAALAADESTISSCLSFIVANFYITFSDFVFTFGWYLCFCLLHYWVSKKNS